MEISDTYLSNELFNLVKNSKKLNQPIDYQKFVCFISIITKGSTTEKLLLLFSIFGKGIPDGYYGNKKMLGYNTGSMLTDQASYDSLMESNSTIHENGNSKIFEGDSLLRHEESALDIDDDADETTQKYEPRVTREDLKLHISGTILSMVNVNFENAQVESLKQSVCRSEENVIDDALELLVDEILDEYAKTNKDEGLTFTEWCEWFTSLDGINEMLMNPT